jgi:hypothetical protein
MSNCCNNLKWKFVADANSTDGCEFTIGKCGNCQANLIHLFYTAVVHEGAYEIVSDALVSQILNLTGKPEQKDFMKEWYRQLDANAT